MSSFETKIPTDDTLKEGLNSIKDAIVALNKADSDATFSQLAYQTKLGSAEKFNPLATQYTVNRTSSITVTMDKIDVTTKLVTEGNASCNGCTASMKSSNACFASATAGTI